MYIHKCYCDCCGNKLKDDEVIDISFRSQIDNYMNQVCKSCYDRITPLFNNLAENRLTIKTKFEE